MSMTPTWTHRLTVFGFEYLPRMSSSVDDENAKMSCDLVILSDFMIRDTYNNRQWQKGYELFNNIWEQRNLPHSRISSAMHSTLRPLSLASNRCDALYSVHSTIHTFRVRSSIVWPFAALWHVLGDAFDYAQRHRQSTLLASACIWPHNCSSHQSIRRQYPVIVGSSYWVQCPDTMGPLDSGTVSLCNQSKCPPVSNTAPTCRREIVDSMPSYLSTFAADSKKSIAPCHWILYWTRQRKKKQIISWKFTKCIIQNIRNSNRIFWSK